MKSSVMRSTSLYSPLPRGSDCFILYIGTHHYYSIHFFYILYLTSQWVPGRGQRGARERLQYKIIYNNILGEILRWLYYFFGARRRHNDIISLFLCIYRRATIRHIIAENETTKKPGVTSPENQQQPSEPSLALVRDYDIIKRGARRSRRTAFIYY